MLWDREGIPISFSSGGPFLSSPSLPACLSASGALSPRWSWPRSVAPHTLLLSSASPRRLFEARRPWWKMRSRCSVGVCPSRAGEYSGLERPSPHPRKAWPGALPGWTGLGWKERDCWAFQWWPTGGFFVPLQGQPPQHRGSGRCPREPFPPLSGHGAVRMAGSGGVGWGALGLGGKLGLGAGAWVC